MRLVTCVIGTQRVGGGRAIHTRQATRGELLAGAPLTQSLFLQGHSRMDNGGRRGQCQCILYARTSSRLLWLPCAQDGSIKLCNIEHSDQLPAVIESSRSIGLKLLRVLFYYNLELNDYLMKNLKSLNFICSTMVENDK